MSWSDTPRLPNRTAESHICLSIVSPFTLSLCFKSSLRPFKHIFEPSSPWPSSRLPPWAGLFTFPWRQQSKWVDHFTQLSNPTQPALVDKEEDFWVYEGGAASFSPLGVYACLFVLFCVCVCAWGFSWHTVWTKASVSGLREKLLVGAYSNIQDTHSVRLMVCICVMFDFVVGDCLRGERLPVWYLSNLSIGETFGCCLTKCCFTVADLSSDSFYKQVFKLCWSTLLPFCASVKLRKAGFGLNIRLPCWLCEMQLLPPKKKKKRNGKRKWALMRDFEFPAIATSLFQKPSHTLSEPALP